MNYEVSGNSPSRSTGGTDTANAAAAAAAVVDSAANSNSGTGQMRIPPARLGDSEDVSKTDEQSASLAPPELTHTFSGTSGGGGGGGGGASSSSSYRNHLHTREQWARRKHRTVGVARPIRVGVAARDKKAHSKPMQEILGRLSGYGHFDIIIFGDECILNQPAEDWPIVDCLISFFSTRAFL